MPLSWIALLRWSHPACLFPVCVLSCHTHSVIKQALQSVENKRTAWVCFFFNHILPPALHLVFTSWVCSFLQTRSFVKWLTGITFFRLKQSFLFQGLLCTCTADVRTAAAADLESYWASYGVSSSFISLSVTHKCWWWIEGLSLVL